jgi:hypothetical protein
MCIQTFESRIRQVQTTGIHDVLHRFIPSRKPFLLSEHHLPAEFVGDRRCCLGNRVKNFSEEYPKRFRKENVKIAMTIFLVVQASSAVPAVRGSVRRHRACTAKLGMGHRMSWSEIDRIVAEVGGDVTIPCDGKCHCVTSANQMFDLAKPTSVWGSYLCRTPFKNKIK